MPVPDPCSLSVERLAVSLRAHVVSSTEHRDLAMKSINPATGKVLREFEEHTDSEVDGILSHASAAYQRWRRLSFAERSIRMRNAADVLERDRDDFARLMTLEMGKPIGAAGSEVEKCAWACRYYADNAEAFLADEPVIVENARAFIRYNPIGAILAVMPWNFPFWQVFRFAAPNLMAGNVGVLKHASNVPQCAFAIADVFRRAGFPEGTFQAMLIGSSRVAAVIDDPRIAAATLTGSEAAGASVAAQAGRRIKKTVLELGGSDPFIILQSADLEAAIETAVNARVINNGQSCIAAKRFIVQRSLREAFESRFVEKMQRLRIGDPLETATQIGPLAMEKLVSDLDRQVRDSIAAGARVLTGGHPIERSGFFYAPTVLVDIPPAAPAFRDELFGPVASVFYVEDLDEAIAQANDSRFGLGSAAWTNNAYEQSRLIDELEAGMVFINGMVASDPRLPFGGVKTSGYGRELGVFGIREFMNIKTVWVSTSHRVLQRSDTE